MKTSLPYVRTDVAKGTSQLPRSLKQRLLLPSAQRPSRTARSPDACMRRLTTPTPLGCILQPTTCCRAQRPMRFPQHLLSSALPDMTARSPSVQSHVRTANYPCLNRTGLRLQLLVARSSLLTLTSHSSSAREQRLCRSLSPYFAGSKCFPACSHP